MGMYIQRSGVLSPVGGGTGAWKEVEQIKDSMQDALGRIEQIERPATEDHAGIVRLCGLTDVTKSDGLALPSSEKNPGMQGTLAEQISKNKDAADSLTYSDRVMYAGLSITDALKEYVTHDRIKEKTRRIAWIHNKDGVIFAAISRDGVNISGLSIFYTPAAAYIKFFLNNKTHFYLYDVPFTQTIIQ